MQDLLPWMAPWGAWSLYALLFVAGLVHVWHGWFRHRFHATPMCPGCGYDRTGLPSDACPECGHTPRGADEVFRSRRRRYWLIALGVFVAGVLPAVAVYRRVHVYGWEYYRRVGPVYWLFPTQTEWAHEVGGYQIDSISDPRANWNGGNFWGEIMRIRRGDTVYFEKENVITTDIVTQPPPGTDLNGNGIPDIIIHSNAGGKSLTHNWIFELGPQRPVLLGEFERGEDLPVIRDVDGDGTWEIIPGWAYASDSEASAASAFGTWDGGKFVTKPSEPAEVDAAATEAWSEAFDG